MEEKYGDGVNQHRSVLYPPLVKKGMKKKQKDRDYIKRSSVASNYLEIGEIPYSTCNI